MFLAELGSEKYFRLQQDLENNPIEQKYINDILYISYYEELNACGKYGGNFEINDDTIKLNINLLSDEVCSSKSIERVTFIVDNPEGKEWVIVK